MIHCTVCGGGNIGHAIAATLAARTDVRISVLTREPEAWGTELEAQMPNGESVKGKIFRVSNDPSIVVRNADIIFLTVPKFGLLELLDRINPCLHSGQAICAVPGGAGFDWITSKLSGRGVSVIGMQRVPYIARTIEYGHKVHIQGTKKKLYIAVKPDSYKTRYGGLFQSLFGAEVGYLSSFMAITLSNSNPILHPARLYDLFGSKSKFDTEPLFYEEWTENASDLLIKADKEVIAIRNKLGLGDSDLMPILNYYESTNASELTHKIRSIKAFAGIKAPMIRTDSSFTPDYSSRYFTEDIPYGTLPIKAVAELAGIRTETIDSLIVWAQDKMRVNYITDSCLSFPECSGLPIPQNYRISGIDEIR